MSPCLSLSGRRTASRLVCASTPTRDPTLLHTSDSAPTHTCHLDHPIHSSTRQAVLREELGADRDVFASMLLLEPSAVVEGCAHDLQKRVTRLVEVRSAASCGDDGQLGGRVTKLSTWVGALVCVHEGGRRRPGRLLLLALTGAWAAGGSGDRDGHAHAADRGRLLSCCCC